MPPCHISPLSSSSNILVHLQVCWGLPLLHFPCRSTQGLSLPHACLVSSGCDQSTPFLFLYLRSFSIGHFPVCFHTSSFQICLGHQICRMPQILRHLLTKTFNFCFSSLIAKVLVIIISEKSLIYNHFGFGTRFTPVLIIIVTDNDASNIEM